MSLKNSLVGNLETVENKTILVIDYSNHLFRMLHVAYSMDPLDEEWVKWKMLMVNGIYNLVKKFKPDQMIIATDKGGSWRKNVYPEYKAQRKTGRDESPIDFVQFFKVANEFYDSIKKVFSNVYFLGLDNVEADDIIGVLTKELAGNDIITVTTDKDMYQLYKHKGYRQFNPIKKQFVQPIGGPKNFANKELNIKILTGDGSDNIPQVKSRMGPKTAEKYLDNLDSLLNESDEIRDKYILNKKLIDMDMIPQEIQDSIKKEYYGYDFSEYSGRKSYSYFGNELPKVLEYIQEINAAFKPLKSYDELKV